MKLFNIIINNYIYKFIDWKKKTFGFIMLCFVYCHKAKKYVHVLFLLAA